MGFQTAAWKEDRCHGVGIEWWQLRCPSCCTAEHLSAVHVLITEDSGVTSRRTKSFHFNSGHKGWALISIFKTSACAEKEQHPGRTGGTIQHSSDWYLSAWRVHLALLFFIPWDRCSISGRGMAGVLQAQLSRLTRAPWWHQTRRGREYTTGKLRTDFTQNAELWAASPRGAARNGSGHTSAEPGELRSPCVVSHGHIGLGWVSTGWFEGTQMSLSSRR